LIFTEITNRCIAVINGQKNHRGETVGKAQEYIEAKYL
jgi:hypothetical protein